MDFENCITHYSDIWRYDINAQALTILNHCASLLNSNITASYNGKKQKPVLWSCIVQDTGTAKSNILKDYTGFLQRKCLEITEDEKAFTCINATYEALCKYSINNNRGILYSIDELSSWIRGMDNYSNGNKEKFMELWNSYPFKVLRKGEAPIIVENPKVNILATTQPNKVADILKDKDLSDGFTNRFLFSNMYDNSFRYDNLKKPHPRYFQKLDRHYQTLWNIKAQDFEFSKEADKVFCNWYNDFSDKHNDIELLKNYLPKLNTYGIRIAPIIHCMHFATYGETKEPSNIIEADIIERTCKILEFFMFQFKAVLDNRTPNYLRNILQSQKIEFQKIYHSLSETQGYEHKELLKLFYGSYGTRWLNEKFKPESKMFIKTNNKYFKAISNE